MSKRSDFRQAVEQSDRDLLLRSLDPTVTFHHPLYADPIRGKKQVGKALGIIGANRGRLEYCSESDGRSTKVLEFKIWFGELMLHGTDLLRFGNDDRIIELCISMRPYPAVRDLFRKMHAKFVEGGIDVAQNV